MRSNSFRLGQLLSKPTLPSFFDSAGQGVGTSNAAASKPRSASASCQERCCAGRACQYRLWRLEAGDRFDVGVDEDDDDDDDDDDVDDDDNVPLPSNRGISEPRASKKQATTPTVRAAETEIAQLPAGQENGSFHGSFDGMLDGHPPP